MGHRVAHDRPLLSGFQIVMIELSRGKSRLTILPETGGGIGVWQLDGKDIFLPVSNEALAAQKGEAVGAYPLIPYSNRIADGRFSFNGQDYDLAPNMGDHPHTIHGNAWEKDWTVAHQGANHAVLTLDHVPQENDTQWPFTYRAVLSYLLTENTLDVQMVVENRDTVDQPVGFGFHPFLAAQGPATLSFDATKAWLTSPDGLPVQAVSCDGEWSFHAPKDAHARFIDNCFAGFGGQVVLDRPDAGLKVTVEADPIFTHLVVFTSPDDPFVAVEPVTSMTDAINRSDIPDRGLHVLKPNTRIGGRMRFHVRAV
ncbi:aldose 1-epimerase [Gluconobacter thailandicus]|uniref:Aldose 1-epimerase n=2 Tax=Gluconobacter thailandicus TaxID=257438 RepID=A0AAP9JHT4_GLUTH|nr:aldose 1-epimerase [Gluconobacter thailandicus]